MPASPVLHQVRPASHYLQSLGLTLSKRGTKPELELKTMPELSHKMWGITPKEMTVIGARTSQGKTSLSLQMCMDLANQGHPVVYMSLEMSIEAVMERMLANYSSAPNWKLQRGAFSELKPEWNKFEDWVKNVPLMITEGHGKSWQEIDDLIKRLNPQPRAIILDYVQCINSGSFNRKEAIDDYIRSFRRHAIDNNYAAILCSQINRAGAAGSDNNEPGMHNLKETGCLEEIADKVILLHWPWFYNNSEDKTKYRLILAKNRNGATGAVNMRYVPEYYRFEDEQVTPKVIDDKVSQAMEIFHATKVTEHTRSPAQSSMPKV